jgi:hypothetical protein
MFIQLAALLLLTVMSALAQTNAKSRRSPKPGPYDYVMLEGHPAGQYTCTAVGDFYRSVRRFSVRLPEAVRLNFHADTK